MLSLALNPPLRHHPTTHLQQRRTVTANFWRWTAPCSLRSSKFPAPQSPSTATHLPGNLGHTLQLPYGSKCSSPSTICCTQAPKQQQCWSYSVSCGRAYRNIAAPGHWLGRPASAPSLPLHSYSSGRLHSAGSLFPSRPQLYVDLKEMGCRQRQQATHTTSLQLTSSRAGQKPSPFQTSQPTLWHAPVDHRHWPGTSVWVTSLPLPGHIMWNSTFPDNRPSSCSQWTRGMLPTDAENSHHVPH
jgi:hypothetical protein